MLRLTTNKFRLSVGGFAALAAVLLLQSTKAFCGVVSEVSAGLTVPQPLASAGDTLNRPAGFTSEVWIETPNFIPSSLELNVEFQYLPFSLKNVGGSNGVQANINMLGIYSGPTVWGGTSIWGIRPFLSADLGILYDYLVLQNANGAATDAGMSFALRAVPGFDLPLMSHLGLVVEFPATVAFQKTTLGMWESSFSLRWKL